MNCFSGSTLLIGLIACGACGAPASGTDGASTSANYAVHYTITPSPLEDDVLVEMTVVQDRGQLREISFDLGNISPDTIRATNELVIGVERINWQPLRDGGKLSWRVAISHQRDSGEYDALLTKDWGIFRAEDIIPRARTRTLKGAKSDTTMSFELPTGWSAVSEYSSLNSRIDVTNDARRFDQPSGWMTTGVLGIRRETIAGTRIAVAAPEGQSVRRMDMLALLNWTLPELHAVLPDAIPRLTIVSANDPMWRGGLSAPASIYIHADRPLISENATSTLLHEVVHVAMDMSAHDGFDWIVEGLAEYYSLELLHRGGAITARRYSRALESQVEWSKQAKTLCGENSSGASTALAVAIFRDLDKELRTKSGGKASLDDVVGELANLNTKVSLDDLQNSVTGYLQAPANTLTMSHLPGCQ